MLIERAKRGALVGGGAFLSSFVASKAGELTDIGDLGQGATLVGIGLGGPLVIEEVLEMDNEMVLEVGEYTGYGLQGAGFSLIGQNISERVEADIGGGEQTGARGETVTVAEDAGSVEVEGVQETGASFSVDVGA